MASAAASAPGSTSSSRRASTEKGGGSGASTPSLSVPTAAVDKSPEDPGRLKTFLSILRRFIGVTDIAAVRFSLPAQLLEPIPNLEYWHYLDRPETFASIGDSDDALGRMLGALRFWFTKDLKYVKGKPCKPYNSTLGEFFRCHWEVEESPVALLGSTSGKAGNLSHDAPAKVIFFCEQTSHHPPVSAYYISCPEKAITASGFDQLSANFTGTRIRVQPGNYNRGIFITLHNRNNETYNMTHPIAHLGGILKGALSVTVSDTCFVTCPESGLKTILAYQEEGWLGKAQNRLVGVVFKYDPRNDKITRVKDVPEGDIVARIEGSWQERIFFTPGNAAFDKSEKTMIVDLQPLMPEPKFIPPEDKQLPNESRRYWHSVTENILSKQYGAATAAKQEIEERQRQKAAERKARNVEWKPRFFKEALTNTGVPELNDEGQLVIDNLDKGIYDMKPSIETAS